MFITRLKNREIPRYVPPQDTQARGMLHRGASIDQPNMTPVRQQTPQLQERSESIEPVRDPISMSQMRRTSSKPLPQNYLDLDAIQQQTIPGSPSTPTSNQYYPSGTLPQNQFPSLSQSSTPQPQIQQQYPYALPQQQLPYGSPTYGQPQYASSQNMDQYAYAPGYQNQYQMSGYMNQQVPIEKIIAV